jgi:Flp pilus assembly protein TadG
MRGDERGQVLVFVAAAFVVLLMFLALLFDGASAIVMRRTMQDGGDAAALAAANLMQVGTPRGCSATVGSTVPRASLVTAARASLTANLPDFDTNTAVITCPAGYQNQAVAVSLTGTGTRFFGGMVGGDLQIQTRSAAVNGQLATSNYSVVELDPSNASWPNGQRGCPSVLLSGGPTVVLDGSMQINSACVAGSGGALATNGNASALTMNNGSKIRIVGGYAPAALTISPAPVTGVAAIKDPLAGLPAVPLASLTVRQTSRLVLNNTSTVLRPGIYQGGIQLKNSSKAFLEPGIYVMEGGGLDVGAQASVLSVNAGVSSTTTATWATNCTVGSCGVLLYNAAGAAAMGQLTVAAGATMYLRAYNPDAQAGGMTDYANLLIWQDASPVPTSSYAQPVLALKGGGAVNISGTVYAPSGAVVMGGSSGGSGGDTVNLTLQFISWDLEFHGNSAFHFFFQDQDFARPTDYGLVE